MLRQISLECEPLEQGIRVRVAGELDLHSSEGLHREIVSACGQGLDYVEIDLARVTFMDTAGVAVLVKAWKLQQSRGGRLRLTHAPGMLLTTIRVVGLGFLLD